MLSVRWAVEGRVFCSALCTTQGKWLLLTIYYVLTLFDNQACWNSLARQDQRLGSTVQPTAVSWHVLMFDTRSMLAIAFHLLLTTCFGWRPRGSFLWMTVVLGIWGYLTIFVTATWYHWANASIYAPTPYVFRGHSRALL